MRLRTNAPALLAALLALAAGGCQSSSTARADEGSAAPAAAHRSSDVVARIGGVEITTADLDQAITGELSGLQQQIYDLRRAELERLVEQRLFEAEA